MRSRASCFLLVLLLSAFASAEDRKAFYLSDISASGLVPVSWANASPTLRHLGFDALLGMEYDSAISVPVRLELGYIRATPSLIASTGELYRAWEGGRIALLSGYSFAPFPVGKRGELVLSLLAGGALTAADYMGTALAFAYPSLVLEPRLALSLGRKHASGLLLALPAELMLRDGMHTLAPGISLGWFDRFGVAR